MLWTNLSIDTTELNMIRASNAQDAVMVEELIRLARERLMNAAEILLAAMQATVPVLTGFLRDSLTIEYLDDDSVRVGTDCTYAAYTEYGTATAPAQGWMQQAIDDSADAVAEAMSAERPEEVQDVSLVLG